MLLNGNKFKLVNFMLLPNGIILLVWDSFYFKFKDIDPCPNILFSNFMFLIHHDM